MGGGLGSMGFGLPSAIGAASAFDVKILILNNQHLGMVVQWEDRFYKANRAHTFLGFSGAEWHKSRNTEDIFPNFLIMGQAFKVQSRRVISPDAVRSTIDEMLNNDGPFLVDVMVPHVEHVLPMIPGGG